MLIRKPSFLDKGCFPKDQDSREELLGLFDIPKFVATRTCVRLNGYFGCRPTYANGHVTRSSTWFRCLVKMIPKVDHDPDDTEPEYVPHTNVKGYEWFEMGIFTRWDSPSRCQVLCVDIPFDLPDQLKALLERRPSCLNFEDPFAMHVDLIDLIIKYYDLSVWRVRGPVRRLEKNRPYVGRLFKPMHDISRHGIHTSEILSATIETLQEMLRYQTEVYDKEPCAHEKTYQVQAKEYLRFQIQLTKSLKLRSDSNQKRLENEVDLAFNNIANQDNTVMKSIAYLTMVFLPATFFSALFSTAFFSFNNGWKVSTGFWIYWVITAPTTFIVVVAFHIWMARTAQV
ncbi:hypothetical protein FOXG_14285 [Fusarium oxysporum f. sp. lycopersici 4287]|uniref:Magnesium transport protein CorA n=1 Tax=Fusarium oxysporum f. sp. lycopersici (strain 4287 / CBS 123668 / FGSC 9935 / NRRL 34936) TaxID=426428 RepID=A0A0J9VYV0_FUSO4|nr:hypothetical protein FOXG_14285 [Fusarium oxysporum f. sp. lycopersici 4287]EWZ78699.1 hypothetical protein FOWG_17077 [Fusarium oxysporum f. sp. lycopersici MN25]KAJ9413675.1 hypothetical protein QL093DRAFT_2628167 [Fusarium oxysporum]KNB15971.1 hypothetical protein FOXG_14285 [Fusarium oxysporum f. sp. lycopersici 4287]